MIRIPINPVLKTIPAIAFANIKISIPNSSTTNTTSDVSETVPLRLYDPAFRNTTVCNTTISEVNGKTGKLTYRGYDVEELAEKSTFLEVAFLLIHGELPSVVSYSLFSLYLF